MRKFWLVLIAMVALVLAGCGGSSPKPKLVKVCSGLTDKCQTAPLSKLDRLAKLTHSTHCHVSDVSDFQGIINWQRAKVAVCGGIAKAGEGASFAGGSQFLANWTGLRAAGLWHTGYWFVRGTVSCETQSTLIINRLRSVGYATDPLAGPFMLDMEVPGANGNGTLAVCIDGNIFRVFHRHAEIYTAPGTWPGGSHGSMALWEATYGSFLSPVWQPVNLWQCTDGIHGCVYNVPGIGFDDVSVNLGVVHGAPSPPSPYAIYPADVFPLLQGQKASERKTVEKWDGAKCRNPVRRNVCKSTHFHLVLLRDRLIFLRQHTREQWTAFDRRARYAGIARRLHQR